MNAYRISGLSPESFRPLFALDDARLRAHDMRRVVADSPRGYPCRVSLTEAAVGETLLLLPYEHHPLGPYRASGPIFVREAAQQARSYRNRLPSILATRQLALRAYDETGWMLDARSIDGAQAEAEVQALLAIEDVAWVMAHNARFGCFLCRIERDPDAG